MRLPAWEARGHLPSIRAPKPRLVSTGLAAQASAPLPKPPRSQCQVNCLLHRRQACASAALAPSCPAGPLYGCLPPKPSTLLTPLLPALLQACQILATLPGVPQDPELRLVYSGLGVTEAGAVQLPVVLRCGECGCCQGPWHLERRGHCVRGADVGGPCTRHCCMSGCFCMCALLRAYILACTGVSAFVHVCTCGDVLP